MDFNVGRTIGVYTCFFFKDTAATENYNYAVVGSVNNSHTNSISEYGVYDKNDLEKTHKVNRELLVAENGSVPYTHFRANER